MPFVSVTRLKVRSVRFLPSFVIHTLRSVRQVKEAQGFRDGALLIDRHWTFWTMTSWDNQDNVRSFMRRVRTGKQCRIFSTGATRPPWCTGINRKRVCRLGLTRASECERVAVPPRCGFRAPIMGP